MHSSEESTYFVNRVVRTRLNYLYQLLVHLGLFSVVLLHVVKEDQDWYHLLLDGYQRVQVVVRPLLEGNVSIGGLDVYSANIRILWIGGGFDMP